MPIGGQLSLLHDRVKLLLARQEGVSFVVASKLFKPSQMKPSIEAVSPMRHGESPKGIPMSPSIHDDGGVLRMWMDPCWLMSQRKKLGIVTNGCVMHLEKHLRVLGIRLSQGLSKCQC